MWDRVTSAAGRDACRYAIQKIETKQIRMLLRGSGSASVPAAVECGIERQVRQAGTPAATQYRRSKRNRFECFSDVAAVLPCLPQSNVGSSGKCGRQGRLPLRNTENRNEIDSNASPR